MNAFVMKRIAAIVLVGTLGASSTAFAGEQTNPPAPSRSAEAQRQTGLIKLIAGGSIATLGALVVANSHASSTVNTGFGKVTASATNTGGMVVGLGMVGGGVFLLYRGAKDRKAAQTSPSIGVMVGRQKGVAITKQW